MAIYMMGNGKLFIKRYYIFRVPNTNLKEGRGVLISRLGSVYEGWFMNDKFHYRGRMIW